MFHAIYPEDYRTSEASVVGWYADLLADGKVTEKIDDPVECAKALEDLGLVTFDWRPDEDRERDEAVLESDTRREYGIPVEEA